MMKQYLLLGLLLVGIIAAVILSQNSTLLRSRGFDVLDFIYAFHAKEGDTQFNPVLDVYKDGVINTFDVLKDRYLKISTQSGIATPSAEASRSAEASSSASTTEATGSAY